MGNWLIIQDLKQYSRHPDWIGCRLRNGEPIHKQFQDVGPGDKIAYYATHDMAILGVFEITSEMEKRRWVPNRKRLTGIYRMKPLLVPPNGESLDFKKFLFDKETRFDFIPKKRTWNRQFWHYYIRPLSPHDFSEVERGLSEQRFLKQVASKIGAPRTTRERIEDRNFWVVSPNVRNDENTVSKWRQASVIWHAAFMGYPPNQRWHDGSGYKFAHRVRPRDVVLIARRHEGSPEVVGFGIVKGGFRTALKGFQPPEDFGSLLTLSPFVPMSSLPKHLPIQDAIRHVAALRQLDPDSNASHLALCRWMLRRLGAGRHGSGGERSEDRQVKLTRRSLSHRGELEYEVRSRERIVRAERKEEKLVNRYAVWLERQGRKLDVASYRSLRCDAYEKERNNLIEAKSSAEREFIRMAVGQLLDYAYQGREELGSPNLAILLPEKPKSDSAEWVSKHNVHLIWEEKRAFVDDANGQFS